MDTKNSKFSKFVAKLEQKMLDGNQESMILTGKIDAQLLGGFEIDNEWCLNDGRCNDHRIANTHYCSNGSCENSMNSRVCL